MIRVRILSLVSVLLLCWVCRLGENLNGFDRLPPLRIIWDIHEYESEETRNIRGNYCLLHNTILYTGQEVLTSGQYYPVVQ